MLRNHPVEARPVVAFDDETRAAGNRSGARIGGGNSRLTPASAAQTRSLVVVDIVTRPIPEKKLVCAGGTSTLQASFVSRAENRRDGPVLANLEAHSVGHTGCEVLHRGNRLGRG